MTGLALTLTYDDLGIRLAMDGLAALGHNLRPLMTDIGSELESSTLERFDTGTSPDGEAWVPPLRVKLKGGQTLVDSGAYRQSFQAYPEDEALEVGSADMRAAALNFGATITAKTSGGLSFTLANGEHRIVQSVKIPARPVVGLSVEDRVVVQSLAEDAIIAAFDASVG